MTPEPKTSTAAPYRWFGCVVLTPNDVANLLHALPQDTHLSNQLQDAAQAAEKLAERLNQIDEGRAA
jgi:hypothetical protein